MTVDGMDMAKFSCPRNTNNSKLYQDCHKPRLHPIGCIIDGVGEYYYIMDADQKKDANAMCEIIATSSEHAERVLASRGVAMPKALSIHSDNCSRELKNQTIAKLGAWLCHAIFRTGVSHTQQEVGHSHGPMDRRFGVAATALARAGVLQTRDDFVDRIHNIVTPLEGMELVAQRLPAVRKWKGWFEKLCIALEGHTGVKAQHVWKFVHRRSCTQVTI